jgi:hypothetical protein
MKEMARTKRLRLPRRRGQWSCSMTDNDKDDDDDDEFNVRHRTYHVKSIERTNKNANRMGTCLRETMATQTIDSKQSRLLPSSSEQSSLFLYSIRSIPKATSISNDLTQLTATIMDNTVPLTDLTSSNTKQTENLTMKIDLTQLTSTDTWASSPINSDAVQLSRLSLTCHNVSSNVEHQLNDRISIDDTDTSMKSIVFLSNECSQDTKPLSYPMYASFSTKPDVGSNDCAVITSDSTVQTIAIPSTTNMHVNYCQQTTMQWNLLLLFIGSSMGILFGIVLLAIIY